MNTDLEQYLKEQGISYKEHKHPAFFTVKESSQYSFPFMRTKSLFMHDENNVFYIVCLDAHVRLSVSKLKKHLDIKELEFASPEEMKEKIKVAPGSVSIFSLIYNSNVLLVLDKKIWLAQTSGFHPNENTSSLELDKENLEKFYNSLPNKKEILDLE
jgi:hypothetical protein